MNTVFALMLVTATGVIEAPNNFSSRSECERVVTKIQGQAYCVEKRPVNVEKEMKTFFALFNQMRMEMENDFNKTKK
jgi:hypothetical protein